MNDETDGRAVAERVRAQMADRARLPWWYVTVQGLAMLALLLQAPVSRLTDSVGGYAALGWPVVIVMVAGPMLLRRVRGADVGRPNLAAYPSTRRMGIAFLAVAAPGALVESLLAHHHLIVAAIALAVLLTAASTAYQVRENAAIRDDIRDGRATPRR